MIYFRFWHNNSKIFSSSVGKFKIVISPLIRYLNDIFSGCLNFVILIYLIRYCIFLAKHTIFKNHKLEWYLLQTIWIDLRHAIEKRSKKFDTMKLKIFFSPPYLISHLRKIYILAEERKYIFMGPNIRIQGYARYVALLCLT